MRRVEDFPEGIGAVVDHGSPVGFDLRNCLVAQPALQKGGDIVMTQVGCVHGDSGGFFSVLRMISRRCCGVPTSASTSQICDARRPAAGRR